MFIFEKKNYRNLLPKGFPKMFFSLLFLDYFFQSE